jgi:arabinofuranosyltransferase
MTSYYADPKFHIIDPLALSDPVLARIPADGRVGHYTRDLPEGYVQSIRTGENWLKKDSMAEYYGHMRTITDGDLWSLQRLETIVRMNTGQYDSLIEEPYRTTVPLENVNTPVTNGTAWDAPETTTFHDDQLNVTLGNVSHSAQIEISTNHNDIYELRFLNEGQVVATTTLTKRPEAEPGIITRRVAMPTEASSVGYTKIQVKAVSGDQKYSLGHVSLLNETGS